VRHNYRGWLLFLLYHDPEGLGSGSDPFCNLCKRASHLTSHGLFFMQYHLTRSHGCKNI
jgi:hypothetical protein